MLRNTILVIACLLMMIAQGAATFHINETVGDFRISFEGKDDINMIAKAWNLTGSSGIIDIPVNESTLDMKNSLMVMAGNLMDVSDQWSAVMVFVMNKPVQTIDAEREFFKNSTYLRIYDRIIDGHKGIYVLEGDGPDDPSMDHVGLFWLDEAKDGTATELIVVVNSNQPEPMSETLIDTVHVEKIASH